MDEEETFNRLKKVPFRDLFISILDPIIAGDYIVPKNRYPLIIASGWDVEDFLGVVESEIEKRTISTSIRSLYDQVWRDTYLRTGPTY